MVRRIFAMYDGGYGVRSIARSLTAEKVPFPNPDKREILDLKKESIQLSKEGKDTTETEAQIKTLRKRDSGWSHMTVRGVLRSTAYVGVSRWNRTKKRDNWGN